MTAVGSRAAMEAHASELERLVADLPRPPRIMEVCGTHTVNICRSGLPALLPPELALVSGPGCPVCVTPQRTVDALLRVAARADVTVATYGDMLRVTGAGGSLESRRSQGADVRVVASALEAVALARRNPAREVVFAAVGFETTAPATAVALKAARRDGLGNFSAVVSHKRVVPAMAALLDDPTLPIDGFLCPGHVAVITGAAVFEPLVRTYRRPCVIVGFEAEQIMEGIVHLVRQIHDGAPRLENLYPEAVTRDGNAVALRLLDEVFHPGDAHWRGLGRMADSGLIPNQAFGDMDALLRFGVEEGDDHDPPGCRCGDVITGRCTPAECPLFARACTPLDPVGPCMVSSEGSCQAHFRYRRRALASGRREVRA